MLNTASAALSEVGGTLLWTPVGKVSRTREFQAFLEQTRGVHAESYRDLHRWSVTHLNEFWSSVAEHFDVEPLRDRRALGSAASMLERDWFPEAELNFAEEILVKGNDSDDALIGLDESGIASKLNRGELREAVSRVAGALRRLGVGTGDVVAGYVANVPEAIVGFLATATLGATWASVGVDFAPSAVVSRFNQLKPTVLFATMGYAYAGRHHSKQADVVEVVQQLTSVRATIMLGAEATAPDAASVQHEWISWRDALESQPADFVRVPFDHPLWVLFTSGTTGNPKGIVQGHGGILLEMLKQLGLHWNLRDDDRLFWFASPSWVMWNMSLSALALGAAILCYSGSATAHGPGTLVEVAQKFGVTFFGTSPAYLAMLTSDPLVTPKLPSLRGIGVTGSPLSIETHKVSARLFPTVPIWSVSGGTDVATAFCGGSPEVPVWAGEISVSCLGVDLQVRTADGSLSRSGEGELVVRSPMPSMPVRLWNDPDGELYRSTYLGDECREWRHGDWVTVLPRGSVIVHGRSDATLNRGGIRMGSADIYAVLDLIPELDDSLIVGLELPDGGYWMPLFVALRDGIDLDAELAEEIKRQIVVGVSPRHAPDEIIQVPAVPRTKTGKRLEVPIKRILSGADPSRTLNLESLSDASTIDFFIALAVERRDRLKN